MTPNECHEFKMGMLAGAVLAMFVLTVVMGAYRLGYDSAAKEFRQKIEQVKE